ncbi:MAG: hypothetical protein H0W86_13945 [Armatimonadetes bacterium]|nr:hypothetical protein [Armatimonadota bacterium]
MLILEDNLIWSGRLRQALRALGHEVEFVSEMPIEPSGHVAIINLSSPRLNPFDAVSKLREKGFLVIGHAGHKEKELWERGREAGCSRIVSNSELTFKLETILAELVP